MVIGLAAAALAAPVVCEPGEAARLVRDANIEPTRVPVTHPWLVPGLARASQAAAAAAVAQECDAGGELVVQRGDQYEGAGWSAYMVVLSRVELEGCSLVHHRVPISVGIGPEEQPHYTVGEPLPEERTPLDASCPDPAVWREQTVIDGENTAVRLVLVVDHAGDQVTHSHVAVRTASPAGWEEQVLVTPAPPRLLDPAAAGPLLRLAPTPEGDVFVVASQDRALAPCRALGGQTVWRHAPGGWVASEGRDALRLLAEHALWRYAGDDGWLLILALDDEEDEDLIDPRIRRLQRRDPEPLMKLHSGDFPGLHAGYVVVTPAPWPTEALADAARGRWRRSALAYVKAAWRAPDPCVPPPAGPSAPAPQDSR
ncbi:MAG: hypothetical protein R3F59_02395 [Myxococcota bacterium]